MKNLNPERCACLLSADLYERMIAETEPYFWGNIGHEFIFIGIFTG